MLKGREGVLDERREEGKKRMAQPSPVTGLEADGMMEEGERKRGTERVRERE